tara:strand:+ start:915 stop:1040 length:126 start_codon:yes stop_codon:yes gene_type:complete
LIDVSDSNSSEDFVLISLLFDRAVRTLLGERAAVSYPVEPG